jgi:hypothetical protein
MRYRRDSSLLDRLRALVTTWLPWWALALAIAPPAQAQEGAVLERHGTSHLASEMACVAGRPYASPGDSVAAATLGITRDETLLHEAVHRKQLAEGPVPCEGMLRMWGRDPLARLDAEVEATCVGLQAYPDTARRARRKRDAIRVVFDLYARLLPVDGPPLAPIYDAFERWC